jgi:hypothetical protein
MAIELHATFEPSRDRGMELVIKANQRRLGYGG